MAHSMEVLRGVSCPSLKDISNLVADEESDRALQKTRFCAHVDYYYYFDRQESKDLNPRLLESSSDGEESNKFSSNLFELPPSDGQEMKDFNPESSKLWSFYCEDEEEEPAPNFLGVLCQSGRVGMHKSFSRDLLLSMAQELQDTWHVPVDKSRVLHDPWAVNADMRKDSMWYVYDDDDSSVDEERVNEYLEKLDAKDKTKKEEVKVNHSLRQVKDYHSLTRSEKLDWLALQVILERYEPYSSSWMPETPPLSGESAVPVWVFEESDEDEGDYYKYYKDYEDYKDSDKEDCILDLNSLFREYTDQEDYNLDLNSLFREDSEI